MKIKIVLVLLLLILALFGACATGTQEQEISVTATEVTTVESLVINNRLTSYRIYSESSAEETLRNNPIDKDYNRDMDIFDLEDPLHNKLFSKYYEVWEQEMDYVLKKLHSVFSEENSNTLKKSQTAWQEYFDNEKTLGYDMLLTTSGIGSGIGRQAAERSFDLLRLRTLQLIEYCYMVESHYEFSYKG